MPFWKRWLYPIRNGDRLSLMLGAGVISHDPWQLAAAINRHVEAAAGRLAPSISG